MKKRKARLTRAQFESLFRGDWVKQAGDRSRKNGKMLTLVTRTKKVFSSPGTGLVAAPTWFELLAKVRGIEPGGKVTRRTIVKGRRQK